ncbi:G-PROTEIN-RECEP-F1-2 domain-containing protein [Aphelenchoides bicaudatus]|nr:G-PROTEIN-RECEP-F1-2 domain-containing protein [Aphelenchoides bicaudatus]
MLNDSELQSATERFEQKCLNLFGDGVTLPQCYDLLKKIIDLENTGAPNCFPNAQPLIEHSPEYFTCKRCFSSSKLVFQLPDCTSIEHLINKFCLPIFILFSFSNILTVLIYRLNYFDGLFNGAQFSALLTFLRLKAIANFIFVQSRILEVIHSWTVEPNASFESVFWTTRPFAITVANICGTISTWLTLLVTIETLLCILLPFSFRQLCTRKTTSVALISCVVASILLHIVFFLMQTVKPFVSIKLMDEQIPTRHALIDFNTTTNTIQRTNCWYVFKFYKMQLSQVDFYESLEKVYYWTQSIFSIILPTCLMLVFSVLIVSKFTPCIESGRSIQSTKTVRHSFDNSNNALTLIAGRTFFVSAHGYVGWIKNVNTKSLCQKKSIKSFKHKQFCVLTFFGPFSVAVRGSESGQHTNICIFNHINNLLCVVNATIPFFVFISCNDSFRNLSMIYLKAQTELRREKRAALLAVALNQRRGGGSQADRSFAGMLLTGKISNF